MSNSAKVQTASEVLAIARPSTPWEASAERVLEARNLPDAKSKEEYAEYLARAAWNLPMEAISEKLREHDPRQPPNSFVKWLERKVGAQRQAPAPASNRSAEPSAISKAVVPETSRPAASVKVSQSPVASPSHAGLWDDVVAEVNASMLKRTGTPR